MDAAPGATGKYLRRVATLERVLPPQNLGSSIAECYQSQSHLFREFHIRNGERVTHLAPSLLAKTELSTRKAPRSTVCFHFAMSVAAGMHKLPAHAMAPSG